MELSGPKSLERDSMALNSFFEEGALLLWGWYSWEGLERLVLGVSENPGNWSQQTQNTESQFLLFSFCLPIPLYVLTEPNRKADRKEI